MSITYASGSNIITGSLGQIVFDPPQVAVVSENNAYDYASNVASLLKGGFKIQNAYSAASGAGAFLTIAITNATSSQFALTASNLSTIYVYTASEAPIPPDAPPIYYYGTGSTHASQVVSLSAKINDSAGNEIVTSYIVGTTSLNLVTVEWGARGDFTQFQSASEQFLFASGAENTGKTYEAVLIKAGQRLTSY